MFAALLDVQSAGKQKALVPTAIEKEADRLVTKQGGGRSCSAAHLGTGWSAEACSLADSAHLLALLLLSAAASHQRVLCNCAGAPHYALLWCIADRPARHQLTLLPQTCYSETAARMLFGAKSCVLTEYMNKKNIWETSHIVWSCTGSSAVCMVPPVNTRSSWPETGIARLDSTCKHCMSSTALTAAEAAGLLAFFLPSTGAFGAYTLQSQSDWPQRQLHTCVMQNATSACSWYK